MQLKKIIRKNKDSLSVVLTVNILIISFIDQGKQKSSSQGFLPVGKIGKKSVCRSAFLLIRHSKYSAILSGKRNVLKLFGLFICFIEAMIKRIQQSNFPLCKRFLWINVGCHLTLF